MKKAVIVVFLIAIATTFGYYAIGYGVASRNSDACEELAFREAVAKNIHGFNAHGTTVTVQRSEVVSSISPFEAKVTYSVPRDLHATVFTKKFHISVFGKISAGKLEPIYLV